MDVIRKKLHVFRTMRPHQWVKNSFVLAPAVFAQLLLDRGVAKAVGLAFVAFCLVSSAVYILNDIEDIEADRVHPVKRFRPIASGALSVARARLLALTLLAVACGVAWLAVPSMLWILAAYLSLNFAYTFGIKHVAYLDVLCIALGFELRVLAGGMAAGVDPSPYLLGGTALLASFLGFGKRLHEVLATRSLKHHAAGQQRSGDQASAARDRNADHARSDEAKKDETPGGIRRLVRRSLLGYRIPVLQVLLVVTAFGTLTLYAMYTVDPLTRSVFHSPWTPWTIVFPAFGMMRFVQLVHRRRDKESPTEAMLRDPKFLLNFVLWATMMLLFLYGRGDFAGA